MQDRHNPFSWYKYKRHPHINFIVIDSTEILTKNGLLIDLQIIKSNTLFSQMK